MKNLVVTINGLVVTINGRKALPVRALCLLAGRKRLSPDVVAGAACGEDHYDGDRHLPTYQLVDGVVHAVDPTHWVLSCEAIESASLLLIGKGPSLRATRTQWFNEATMLLPGGVFVWLDEFQDWFRRTRPYRVKEGKTGLQLEQPEEGRVSLVPPISDELRACLLAGFSPTPALPTAPTLEQPAGIEPEQAQHQGEPAEAPRSTQTMLDMGVTKAEILAVFRNPIQGQAEEQWAKMLADARAKWLKPARVDRGGRRVQSRWNPAKLAMCLASKMHMGRGALGSLIRRYFPEYLPEWQAYAGSFD